MLDQRFVIHLTSDSESNSDRQARALLDSLREIVGVRQVDRGKKDLNTMDLGTVITVLASSGATLAVSQGIADWLRSRRSTTLKIERDASSGSIKATVERIDPDTAIKIIEIVREG